MKFAFGILFLAFLVAFASAVSPQKQVVVSYPKDTPQSVLDKAMEAIRKAVRLSSSSEFDCPLNDCLRAA